MTSQTLERLLIDRATGELSPDVAELLEEHLRREPAARLDAAELDETLRLARKVFAATSAAEITVIPRAQFPSAKTWAMAACFVGGLALGLVTTRGGHTMPHPVAVAENRSVTTPPANAAGFWSARRLRAALAQESVKSPNPVKWNSPVQKPKISL